jgi:hypothetical protein
MRRLNVEDLKKISEIEGEILDNITKTDKVPVEIEDIARDFGGRVKQVFENPEDAIEQHQFTEDMFDEYWEKYPKDFPVVTRAERNTYNLDYSVNGALFKYEIVAKCYCYLMALKRQGHIHSLERNVKFADNSSKWGFYSFQFAWTRVPDQFKCYLAYTYEYAYNTALNCLANLPGDNKALYFLEKKGSDRPHRRKKFSDNRSNMNALSSDYGDF